MLDNEESNFNSINDEHPSKELVPILDVEGGNKTSVNVLHSKKAKFSILFTNDEIDIFFNDDHNAKEYLSIELIIVFAPNDICSNDELLLNSYCSNVLNKEGNWEKHIALLLLLKKKI